MIISPQQLIALLPLLIIALTLLIVMLSIAWRRNHFVNAVTTIVGLNMALLSLWFVGRVEPLEVTSLLRVDGFSMLYSALCILACLATSVFAYAWLKKFPDNVDEFYLLILFVAMGGVVLASASHLSSLFIGIELLSLPLFGLIGYAIRKKHALEAAIKYTILSAAASSLLLFGIALIYADSGSLSLVRLGETLTGSATNQRLLLAGFGLMLVGFCFKLSIVPFHLWTPDVYQGAPVPAAVLLATVSKIAIFSVVVRLFISSPITDNHALRLVLAAVAFISIIAGNLMAVVQNNIKRLLGYSSIAHVGYLLVALITVHQYQLSLETVGVYLAGYLLSTLGAFGVVSLMSSPYQQHDAESLYSYRGLFWHRPMLSAAMTTVMLSLAGIPLTFGFIGKFYVIASAVDAELWWLNCAVVVGSAIGLYYYLRVIVSLYLSAPEMYKRLADAPRASTAGDIVVLLSAVLVIVLGIYPQPLITLVKLAKPLM